MKHVSNRLRNPFGVRAPRLTENGTREAVYGYGDAGADFQLIGDHPGVHGGVGTGVPFTETEGSRRLQRVLADVGLLEDAYSDAPTPSNLYLHYVHASVTEDGRTPTEAEYHELEPLFDAEVRAVNAHVLLPVGAEATRRVLRKYTIRAEAVDVETSHARQVRGRGFLVVPIADPETWSDADEEAIRSTLGEILASDYRQTKGVATLVG